MEKILSLIWTIKHKIILNTKFVPNLVTKERLNLSSKQFRALLSVPDCLSELYNGWASDEHISTYSDVTKLLTTISDKIIMTTSEENLVVY